MLLDGFLWKTYYEVALEIMCKTIIPKYGINLVVI